MPVIDYAKMREFPMRAGITGKWIAGHEHGSTSTSVLSNTVEPGVAVPRHFHEYEEVVLVEAGEIWVELDKVRRTATPGQCVIILPHTPHAWGTTGPGTARGAQAASPPARSVARSSESVMSPPGVRQRLSSERTGTIGRRSQRVPASQDGGTTVTWDF